MSVLKDMVVKLLLKLGLYWKVRNLFYFLKLKGSETEDIFTEYYKILQLPNK